MRSHLFLSLGALAVTAFAQDVFESADFNITEALLSNGVNVSALPELDGLSERRSLFSPCSAAVCHFIPDLILHH
jgi:hypothetical protein